MRTSWEKLVHALIEFRDPRGDVLDYEKREEVAYHEEDYDHIEHVEVAEALDYFEVCDQDYTHVEDLTLEPKVEFLTVCHHNILLR